MTLVFLIPISQENNPHMRESRKAVFFVYKKLKVRMILTFLSHVVLLLLFVNSCYVIHFIFIFVRIIRGGERISCFSRKSHQFPSLHANRKGKKKGIYIFKFKFCELVNALCTEVCCKAVQYTLEHINFS